MIANGNEAAIKTLAPEPVPGAFARDKKMIIRILIKPGKRVVFKMRTLLASNDERYVFRLNLSARP
jgi:hypothetical protein